MRLLIEVEKALNSAEAAEIAAQWDPVVMAQYMEDAGLRFLPEPTPVDPTAAGPTRAQNASSDSDGEKGTSNDSRGSSRSARGEGVEARRRRSGKTGRKRRATASKQSNDGSGGRSKDELGERHRPAASGSSKRRSSTSVSPSSPSRHRDSSRGAGAEPRGKNTTGGDSKHRNGPEGSSGKGRKPKRLARAPEASPNDGEPEEVSREGRKLDGGASGNPLEAFVVPVEGAGEGAAVQCLPMVDERDRRLVLAVGDALTGEALLRSLIEKPAVLQLAAHGLVQETAYVNRAAFQVGVSLAGCSIANGLLSVVLQRRALSASKSCIPTGQSPSLDGGPLPPERSAVLVDDAHVTDCHTTETERS